jgi:GTP-binding protein HflX
MSNNDFSPERLVEDFEASRFVWNDTKKFSQTRGFLVGAYKRVQDKEEVEEHLEELQLLCDTQGIPVVSRLAVFLRHMTAATFLSEGKLEELRNHIVANNATLVVFDDEITPAQQRNLEKILKVPVIDRTEVILNVFVMRAKSKEAKLQVELAQVKYQIPRLKRLWTHLSRQAGGGGGASGGGYLKGEGEKQIEIDRRILKKKVDRLEKEIDEIRVYRDQQRNLRERSGIPVIALVGYTNAGKSTLMNSLTEAGVYVEDKLFATLDTTTRKYLLSNRQEVLFTDTVGFIRKLPHLLVAAFSSTLEESVHADIILHVIDASQPMAFHQAEATLQVLDELKADTSSIVTVLNKVDRVASLEAGEAQKAILQKLKLRYPRSQVISAKEKTGLAELEEEIIRKLQDRRVQLHLRIPQSQYHLIAACLREGRILRQEYEENDVLVSLEVPAPQAFRFIPYKID